MFKKEEKLNNFNEAETIIGESVHVKGNFESSGNIIINGMLEGEVKTASAILIGEKAKIEANIEAEEMMVRGFISGNIKIRGYLAIGDSAKIIGNIECAQISIEKGAEINGSVSINNKQEKGKQQESSLNNYSEEEKEDQE